MYKFQNKEEKKGESEEEQINNEIEWYHIIRRMTLCSLGSDLRLDYKKEKRSLINKKERKKKKGDTTEQQNK